MKRVLAFGSFDPLHEGHQDFLRQAKALGDHLTVVVARNSSILASKGYQPPASEEARLAAVATVSGVNTALLGNKSAHHYELLKELKFDVLVLGYDQLPTDAEVIQALKDIGKHDVQVVRLKPFQPEKYKSTLLRQ